jgi:hypothetical protein
VKSTRLAGRISQSAVKTREGIDLWNACVLLA